MDKIRRGIDSFHRFVFPDQRQHFEALASKQQKPRALFVTCSDSRVNPNLFTQQEPGELFLLRNAGNIIPPYGHANGGEAATVEYAVAVLKVRHIIVCGHSHCGAMKALLDPAAVAHLHSASGWFAHAEAARQIIRRKYSHLKDQELETATVQQNVLVQLNNLRTHPSVAAGVATGELQLHGWYYCIETGEVCDYRRESESFEAIDESAVRKAPAFDPDRNRVPALAAN